MSDQQKKGSGRKPEKQKSIFRQEMERDRDTFKSLDFKRKLSFIYDYYKYYILLAITVIIVVITFARLLYDGQKPYRLRVCAVLNTEDKLTSWFREFKDEMKKDGKEGDFDLNEDQPFDYANAYYNLHEIEVQTTISSRRMDVAICNPDMFKYLSMIDACMPLSEVFTPEELNELIASGRTTLSKSNFAYNKDGTIDESQIVEDYFALDLSTTSFGLTYNTKDNDEKKPLYAVVIRNTKNPEDSIKLMHYLLD